MPDHTKIQSLPFDPSEAIGAALKIMHPDGETYPEGFLEALHLSTVLYDMIRGSDGTHDPASTAFVLDHIEQSLRKTAKALDQMACVLKSTAR